MIVYLLFSTSHASDFQSLYEEAGWEHVGTSKTKEGTVTLRFKVISKTPCVQGSITVDTPASVLYEVVTDIPAIKKFSSETFVAAELLSENATHLEYYQHLDTPNWTFAADRFWVLRAQKIAQKHTLGIQWDRFEWKEKYPDLAKRIGTKPIEPVMNFGAWIFQEENQKTLVKYYICSDPGGNIPYWIKKKAAKTTLPGTVADVMREGRRRRP
ncbi:MAG: hypothetical protein VX278_05440 [Myxococcota bacterium]|nr:hypothetical protein [Myxococcota bacterium]